MTVGCIGLCTATSSGVKPPAWVNSAAVTCAASGCMRAPLGGSKDHARDHRSFFRTVTASSTGWPAGLWAIESPPRHGSEGDCPTGAGLLGQRSSHAWCSCLLIQDACRSFSCMLLVCASTLHTHSTPTAVCGRRKNMPASMPIAAHEQDPNQIWAVTVCKWPQRDHLEPCRTTTRMHRCPLARTASPVLGSIPSAKGSQSCVSCQGL